MNQTGMHPKVQTAFFLSGDSQVFDAVPEFVSINDVLLTQLFDTLDIHGAEIQMSPKRN